VRIYFDSMTAPPIATGMTDAVGGLAAVTWTVPSVSAGAHRLIVMDVRSQFPSYQTFTVN
jgi:hypothetical protein